MNEYFQGNLSFVASAAAVWCPRFSVFQRPDTLKGGHQTRFSDGLLADLK